MDFLFIHIKLPGEELETNVCKMYEKLDLCTEFREENSEQLY